MVDQRVQPRSTAPREPSGGPLVETRVSTRRPPPGRADVAARRRLVVPARVRIMGWLILLLAVVLLTVVVVTRNLLVADAESDATAALRQETEEFRQVAEFGVDRFTQLPFADGRDLLANHVQRQFTDPEEIVFGVTPAGVVLSQAGERPFTLAPPDVAAIVADPDGTGELATDVGRLRWSKVPVFTGGRPDGTFVVAYALDQRIRDVDETVRVLGLVSLLGLLLAAGASWIVSGQILAPVNVVRRTAAAITHEDLTRRIPIRSNDDIAALSDQFNAMLDRLEQAFLTQRRFLDDASHELRTPITIIRGNLEFVDDDDPRERAEVVRLCLDELDRMSRIVEDLLLLAKSEHPDFVVPEPVSLVDLTSDIDAKLRALGDRRWRLESIAEGEAAVDPQRVTQAVVQLAHNAVQHTSPGDAVVLGSSATPAEVRFWITDSGPGVRPEDGQAIFQRFSRGAAGVRLHETGAGLGLAIVTAIAQAHGGSVELRSVPGHGATFTVRLPRPGAPERA